MTIEERLVALEAKTQDMERHTFHDEAKGVDIPYVTFACRMGVFTNFWCRQPIGQGAAFSVGTNSDRFAGYFEIDEQVCPDHPSVAVYASVVPESRFNQPHIAFHGVAGNAPDKNGVSQNHGLFLEHGDRMMALQREGLQLFATVPYFVIGKAGGPIRALWP